MACFVSLTYPPSCGKLRVPPDLDRDVCGYYGHDRVMRRGGGIVSEE